MQQPYLFSSNRSLLLSVVRSLNANFYSTQSADQSVASAHSFACIMQCHEADECLSPFNPELQLHKTEDAIRCEIMNLDVGVCDLAIELATVAMPSDEEICELACDAFRLFLKRHKPESIHEKI